MEYGNVLVIGNSGVGKSTLINAVLGKSLAKVGGGISGVTKKLVTYESEDKNFPFRIIDTIGFEPSFFKRNRAIKAAVKWSKEAAKDNDPSTDINVIWFCVEGTSRKLFPDAIKSLSKATTIWKSVPVIAVITKSYSEPERAENIETVKKAFESEKRFRDREIAVIPVVAEEYWLNDTAFAAPEGITELIDATNAAMPEGKRAAAEDVATFKLGRRRAMAHGVVGAAAVAGAAVGAAPVPVADAAILVPLENTEVSAIAGIYGLKKGEQSKKFIDTVVETGTISAAAKAAISALKKILEGKIPESLLNAVVAGCIVAIIGEGSISAFETVYRGEKTLDDIEWLKKLIESKLSKQFVTKGQEVIEKVAADAEGKDPMELLTQLLQEAFGEKAAE